MTPELWQRIKAVLEEVESAPAADRTDVLNRLCQGDAGLRREVEPFLAEDDAGTFIRGAIGEQAASLSQTAARQERFGRYQLVRHIAMGGMGAVYEAARVDDFHKKVALKIIQQGLDSEFARTRFVQERQLLAGLEHPYIARLLDGGETDDGSPYLVLEFVDGQPITEYCASLDRAARLRLFLKVCDAVEHAHRNLVVHRDLKPANILVTANGDPKLLDFGIAKLLDPAASSAQTGFVALTPDYASPEQVRGEPITTASDVYSLGVILYQLLTDRKPYRLNTATVLEMDRVICQQPPAAPGLGDELDHILLMALRKEPQRRYGSVQQFARDIERYLDHRPVSARPDTFRYRAQKFARRNWWQMAAVAMVIVSLSAGLAVSLMEQRRASRRFNQVRQLANRFLFDFHDEIAKTPGTVKAREMIVSTALEYLNSLVSDAGGDPGLQWELAVAYGKVAAVQGSTIGPSLRRRSDAAGSYDKALALARPLAARNRLDAAQRVALVNLLCEAELIHRSLTEFDAAIRLGREAIERSAGLSGYVQRRAMTELASTLGRAGDLTGSVNLRERLLPEIREIARREPSFDNRRALAGTLVDLGYFQARLTRFPEAIAHETEALTLYRELAEERPGDVGVRTRTFNTLFFLGLAEGAPDRPSLGRFREATTRFGEALTQIDILVAADPHDRATRHNAALAHNQIAYLLRDSNPVEAIRQAAEAAKLLDGVTDSSTEDWAQSRMLASDACRNLHQFAQAEGLLKEAGRILKVSGADAEAALNLSWARLDVARGDTAAAAGWFDQAIALYEKLLVKTPTPGAAWTLTQALDFAATAIPSSAQSRRQRILAVWTDQSRRFPGQVYIENQVLEARTRLTAR